MNQNEVLSASSEMAAAPSSQSQRAWTHSLTCVPNITMSDVVEMINQHSKVPGKHLDKGYKFFHGSYVHNIEVKVNERGCYVRGRCYRSQRKNETPWSLHVSLLKTKVIESQSCGCSAGKGSCAHVAALVYQLAHYKILEMEAVPDLISKTSCPQKWHVPPRTHGIVPRPLSDVKFVRPKATRSAQSEQCVCSTLYKPVVTEFPDTTFMNGLKHILPMHGNIQLLQVLPDDLESVKTKETAFGSVFIGSSLAHQLPEPKSDGTIIKIQDGAEFPTLPMDTHDLTCPYATVLTENEQLFFDGLQVTQTQAQEIEEQTRQQSNCPDWHRLRQKRLTSSKFKEIVIRKKDFDSLTERLSSKRTIQTQAMKHGLQNEENAALEYATHNNANVKTCGFIVNPQAPYLGSSPDRIVYDPNEDSLFGVLEVKCPMNESYRHSNFLKENRDGSYSLKQSHAYYLQVMGQMAISGLTWADFCVWTINDMHIERIYFDNELWASTHKKLAMYYFEYFIKKYV